MELRKDITNILSKKYKQLEKFGVQLSVAQKSGKFFRYTSNKRFNLLTKLRKLTKRVSQLNWKVKLAAITSTVAVLGNPNDAVAQSSLGPFVSQNRAFNPLRYPIKRYEQKPTAVDLDNDGDYDIVSGDRYGYIKIFLNEGDLTNPAFTDFLALDQTQTPINLNYKSAPAFADLNGDGNIDLIAGIHDGSTDRLQYFTGNGGIPGDQANPLLFTEQTGPWDGMLKTGNPFYSITPGNRPSVTFVNFDGDSDMDALIGSDYQGTGTFSINYFENDGQSNFTLNTSEFVTNPSITFPSNDRTSPQLVDIDEDGKLDLVTGRQAGDLRFFKGDGAGNFNEQTGTWDPILKTGNPFNSILKYGQSAPAFADLDNDGDLDLLLGFEVSYKYSQQPLEYYENKGDAIYEEITGLDNPFDGIDVGREAAQQLIDIDGDGDLDAVIGSKYGGNNYEDPDILVFVNNSGSFTQDIASSIAQVSTTPYQYNIKPVLVDIDNDGDQDLFVTSHDDIEFFRDNLGVYESETSPINHDALVASGDLTYTTELSLAFIDVDGDGDFDAFIGGDGVSPDPSLIQFLENQGTPEVPNFVGVAEPAPFDTEVFENRPNIVSVDIDNDGDLDIVLAETIYNSTTFNDNTIFRLFNNNGDGTFSENTIPIMGLNNISGASSISFADLDKDGDLDAFIGYGYNYNKIYGGTIGYFLNQNPPPTTTVNSSILDFTFGAGPVVVDATLVLSDTDNDLISRATVAIQNFQPNNEVLSFTTQTPVTGVFDAATGILTLLGNAPISTYESILRTVAYEYIGPDPGARKGSSGKIKAITRTINFSVLDADRTIAQVASRTVNVASVAAPINLPPTILPSTLNTVINNSVTIDLTTIISDPDGNLDPLSFVVIPNISPTPGRIGNATIANSILTVDYTGTNFAGLDFVTIEACDLGGLCSTAELTIQVEGSIIIRNGISPNGDGLNDFFKIDNITTLGAQNRVTIFTRWGDKVFEIEDYDNQNRRFEGRSDGGKELSSGVYFYKIEFTNGQPEQSGYLTLKR